MPRVSSAQWVMWGHHQWPWTLLSSRKAHSLVLGTCNRCLINANFSSLSSFARMFFCFLFSLVYQERVSLGQQVSLKLAILLPPPLQGWGYKRVHLAQLGMFLFWNQDLHASHLAFLYNTWQGAFDTYMFGVIWVMFRSNFWRNGEWIHLANKNHGIPWQVCRLHEPKSLAATWELYRSLNLECPL